MQASRCITVIGGRYGLGSKDTPPRSVFAVYEELTKAEPKRQFTIGIGDIPFRHGGHVLVDFLVAPLAVDQEGAAGLHVPDHGEGLDDIGGHMAGHAKEIGMGKRTNTILQSAFFSLAKVMPEAEAIQYMKDRP